MKNNVNSIINHICKLHFTIIYMYLSQFEILWGPMHTIVLYCNHEFNYNSTHFGVLFGANSIQALFWYRLTAKIGNGIIFQCNHQKHYYNSTCIYHISFNYHIIDNIHPCIFFVQCKNTGLAFMLESKNKHNLGGNASEMLK